MGGVVKISDAVAWMVAGWAHDNVLQDIAENLPIKENELRALMLDNRTQVSVGYCDLRELNTSQISLLIKAANIAYQSTIVAGPQSFHAPRFYPAYINGFKRLIEMLENDPRSKG